MLAFFGKRYLKLFPALAFACLYVLVFFTKAMIAFIDHDEHQFIAAASLMYREGLIPFLDFPYIHSPYYSLLLSFFSREGAALLFNARLINVIFIMVLPISWMYYWFKKEGLKGYEFLLMGLLPLLIFSTPSFLYTSSHAWNHPPSLALIFLAFVLLFRLEAHRPQLAMLQSLLATLGCLIRLSYAPLGLLFFLLALYRLRLSKAMLYWLAGAFIAFIPMLYWWVLSPDKFLFGLWHFHTEIDHLYFIKTGVRTAQDSVFADFINLILTPPNAPVLIAFAFALGLFLSQIKSQSIWKHYAMGALLFFVLALTAALMKGIIFQQYLALPFVFILLFIAAVWQMQESVKKHLMTVVLFFAVGAAIGLNHDSFWRVYLMGQTDKWTALNVHTRSVKLLDALPEKSEVFTLSPIFPLEAGYHIDPRMVNGPFLWRTSFIIPEEERPANKILGPSNLQEWFPEQAYPAVMLGHEVGNERELKAYVQQHYDSLGDIYGLHLYVRRNAVLSDIGQGLPHTAKSQQ